MTTNQNQALMIERVFNLPVNKVWAAFTQPEIYKKWWGPKEFTCPSASLDVKVGGKYLSCMHSEHGDFWSTGTYKEVIPNKKLVCTDNFSDEKGNIVPPSAYNMPGEWANELIIAIAFEEINGKTKMALKHEGLPEEMLKDCEIGWQQSFDKLEANIQ